MKLKRGSTSVRRLVFIGDSSSTTGAGLANLAHNTSGLVAWYFAGDLSNDLQITLASATLGTYTSGGFVAVDNTNMPGWYEFGIPNTVLDGGNEVAIQLRGAANMLPVNIYIELDSFDYQTATQPVNVTQFGGVDGAFSGGRPEVNATHWGGAAVASANVLIDGAITAAKIASNAMNGKGDWGTSLNLAALIETVGEAGSGLTDVTTQVAAALAAAHGAGSWATATGFSTLTASGVRDALGMATNNLDTQLGLLATSSALAALVNTVGVAGAGLTEAGGTGDQFTAIPWNAAWDAQVQSECADALIAYDPPTKAEQDSAFTEIKGAGWASSTDTLEKIRDASGGGGGSTVQINPIAISTGGPAEAPLMTCHQGEYGYKAYLFYDIDAYGQRSATDFSSYTDLRIGVALPDGTAWIETADITVSANQLTIPVGDLTNDVGTFDATLWDWAGAGATDQRLVVACMQLVVTEAVGADEVVT